MPFYPFGTWRVTYWGNLIQKVPAEPNRVSESLSLWHEELGEDHPNSSSTWMGTQSLSWSLFGLWPPGDCGVPTCGGLKSTVTHMQSFLRKRSETKGNTYLSRLRSHSSWASSRILSSSPCRVEEMLSSGPVRLSLRLTAAMSSSSSTQEPDGEETASKNICYRGAAVSSRGE